MTPCMVTLSGHLFFFTFEIGTGDATSRRQEMHIVTVQLMCDNALMGEDLYCGFTVFQTRKESQLTDSEEVQGDRRHCRKFVTTGNSGKCHKM